MPKNRDDMKQLLSQFVDQLFEAEIETIKLEISSVENTVSSAISEMKEDIRRSLESVRQEFAKELDQIKKATKAVSAENSQKLNQIAAETNNKMSEFETNLAQAELNMKRTLDGNSKKVTAAVEQTLETTNAQIANIETRVTANEGVLDLARNDHEKLTMVLGAFASSITNVSPVAPAVPADTPTHTQPTITPEPAQVQPTPEPVFAQAAPEPIQVQSVPTPEPIQTQPTPTVQPIQVQPVATPEPVANVMVEPEISTANSQSLFIEDEPEFAIDLAEVDFKPTEANPHMDVIVDPSGQHIYKPY